MKKISFLFVMILCLSACEAGKFTPQRNHLHNLGNEDVCQRRSDLCVDNIPW